MAKKTTKTQQRTTSFADLSIRNEACRILADTIKKSSYPSIEFCNVLEMLALDLHDYDGNMAGFLKSVVSAWKSARQFGK